MYNRKFIRLVSVRSARELRRPLPGPARGVICPVKVDISNPKHFADIQYIVLFIKITPLLR